MLFMTDVESNTHEVFNNPDFELLLTEWQRAHIAANSRGDAFTGVVSDYFRDGVNRTRHSTEEQVSYVIGMDDQSFHDAFAPDTWLANVRNLWKSAEGQKNDNRSALLAGAQEHGMGEFALYGLSIHTSHDEPMAKTALREKVEAAEHDLKWVDELVRRNAGQLVTTASMVAGAAILGEDGIKIDDKGLIVFPIAEGHHSYSTSIASPDRDTNKLYKDPVLAIRAAEIHGILGSRNLLVIQDWSSMLRNPEWISGIRHNLMLAFGSPVKGEPSLEPQMTGPDKKYFRWVFNRIRTIGEFAMVEADLS